MRKLVYEKPPVETVDEWVSEWAKKARSNKGWNKLRCCLGIHGWVHYETVLYGSNLKVALGYKVCLRCGKSKVVFIL